MSIDFIQKAKFVFWDFDGVIKDSVEVKTAAFEHIFLPFGKDIAKKVKIHHELNGGMSRFDKLPIYLNWADKKPSTRLITEYAEIFSLLVEQKVVDSPWVTGVLDYLQNNYQRQQFFLVTATPQQEIENIISQLKITNFFVRVVGSPINKTQAIKMILKKYSIDQKQAVMIGDSRNDYDAATSNKINFILRKTSLNQKIQDQFNCLTIVNF
jgi:phosphoglycolate phosphatase-like HAD superfamily hydrolase